MGEIRDFFKSEAQKETNVQKRAKLIEAMDVIMAALNNEDAYYGSWLVLGPGDGASKEDYKATASYIEPETFDGEVEDSCYESACKCFVKSLIRYARHGFYTGYVTSAEFKKKDYINLLLETIDDMSKYYDINDERRYYVPHEIATIYEFLSGKSSEGISIEQMVEYIKNNKNSKGE